MFESALGLVKYCEGWVLRQSVTCSLRELPGTDPGNGPLLGRFIRSSAHERWRGFSMQVDVDPVGTQDGVVSVLGRPSRTAGAASGLRACESASVRQASNSERVRL